MLYLASCGAEVDVQPVITSSALAGTWTAAAGATMMFSSSGQFAGHRLSLMPDTSGCGNVSGNGTWQFLNSQGYSPQHGQYYAKGNVIGIVFSSPVNAQCGYEFTTWTQGSRVGLCLYLDPDSPCTGEVFMKKQ